VGRKKTRGKRVVNYRSDSWDKKRGTFFQESSMNGVMVTLFVGGLMEYIV
jgi:hypothetical protein